MNLTERQKRILRDVEEREAKINNRDFINGYDDGEWRQPKGYEINN